MEIQRRPHAPVLNEEERDSVEHFFITHVVLSPNENLSIVEKSKEDRKRRRSEAACYRSVNHILPTSNIVERLFSQAKFIMSDSRKHMDPEHLDQLLFLKYNKSLWTVATIQELQDVRDIQVVQSPIVNTQEDTQNEGQEVAEEEENFEQEEQKNENSI